MFRQPKRQIKTAPFVLKLAQILDDEQQHHLASWTEDGTAFAIHNPEMFAAKLLPQYFRHSNYGSFLRQLNLYNFNKLKPPNDTLHHFHHPLFLENHRQQHHLIKRIRPQKAAHFEHLQQPQNQQFWQSGESQSEQVPGRLGRQSRLERMQGSIQRQIESLRRNQTKLLNECREVVDQSVETIQWGLIRSAEIQNDSSNNQLICNRIFSFLQRYPHMAGQLSYLDTALVRQLLDHLDTGLAEYFAATAYHPAIQKFFAIIEKHELGDVVECINSALMLERKKSFTILGLGEKEMDYRHGGLAVKQHRLELPSDV